MNDEDVQRDAPSEGDGAPWYVTAPSEQLAAMANVSMQEPFSAEMERDMRVRILERAEASVPHSDDAAVSVFSDSYGASVFALGSMPEVTLLGMIEYMGLTHSREPGSKVAWIRHGHYDLKVGVAYEYSPSRYRVIIFSQVGWAK